MRGAASNQLPASSNWIFFLLLRKGNFTLDTLRPPLSRFLFLASETWFISGWKKIEEREKEIHLNFLFSSFSLSLSADQERWLDLLFPTVVQVVSSCFTMILFPFLREREREKERRDVRLLLLLCYRHYSKCFIDTQTSANNRKNNSILFLPSRCNKFQTEHKRNKLNF